MRPYLKYKNDIEIGEKGEIDSKKVLEEYFNMEFEFTPKNHNFDLFKDNVFIEIKTRRCFINSYKTLYFSHAKYKYIQNNPNNNYLFLFNLKDGMYLWEYSEKQLNMSYGGRTDRGKNERKKLCEIPTKYLKKVS
jgi:hypothetical protein